MKLILDASKTSFYTGSKPEVKPVFAWVDGKKAETQNVDLETGLPVWTATAEFIQGNNIEEGAKIKILSKTEPELAPRTEYVADGDILASSYLKDGARFPTTSITVIGGLRKAHGALPKASN